MESGRVAWFNENQGFGYITLVDGRKAYFHYTGVSASRDKRSIVVGEQVCFHLLETVTGLEAFDVKRQ